MVSVQKCFAVLGNDLRAGILEALKSGPMGVGELAEKLGEERSNVSHSLAVLKKCGFVDVRKSGRKRLYSLSSCIVSDMKVTGNIFELMEYHIAHHCHGNCELKK